MITHKLKSLRELDDKVLIQKYESLSKLAQLYKRNKDFDLLQTTNEAMDEIDREISRRYK